MEPETIAQLEAEWQAEGVPPDEVGRRLAEIAEREAAEAEQEEQEQEDDRDGPPALDAVSAAIAAAHGLYVATVAEVLGGLEQIQPCPYCAGMGFDPLELPQDPNARTCETCRGHGNVVTGSKVPGNETRVCTACRGAGYVTEEPTVQAPPTPPVPQWTPPVAPAPVFVPAGGGA